MVSLSLQVFYDLGPSDFLFAPLRRGRTVSYLAGLLWGSDALSARNHSPPVTAVRSGATCVPGRAWQPQVTVESQLLAACTEGLAAGEPAVERPATPPGSRPWAALVTRPDEKMHAQSRCHPTGPGQRDGLGASWEVGCDSRQVGSK